MPLLRETRCPNCDGGLPLKVLWEFSRSSLYDLVNKSGTLKGRIGIVCPNCGVSSDFPSGKIRDDMHIIHFTYAAAADPLDPFAATGARFVPLMEGQGNSQISCLHLGSKSKIASPSLAHAAALLVVRGRITVTTHHPQLQIDVLAGMGCVFEAREPYAIESETGAIVIIIEAECLAAHERGISTPQRIGDQSWHRDADL